MAAVAALAAGMKASRSAPSGNMFDRISGLRKMMYAITRNVVTPARTSVPMVVPRSLSLNHESNPLRGSGAGGGSLLGTSAESTATRLTLRSGARGSPDTSLGTGAAAQPTPRRRVRGGLFR